MWLREIPFRIFERWFRLGWSWSDGKAKKKNAENRTQNLSDTDGESSLENMRRKISFYFPQNLVRSSSLALGRCRNGKEIEIEKTSRLNRAVSADYRAISWFCGDSETMWRIQKTSWWHCMYSDISDVKNARLPSVWVWRKQNSLQTRHRSKLAASAHAMQQRLWMTTVALDRTEYKIECGNGQSERHLTRLRKESTTEDWNY